MCILLGFSSDKLPSTIDILVSCQFYNSWFTLTAVKFIFLFKKKMKNQKINSLLT